MFIREYLTPAEKVVKVVNFYTVGKTYDVMESIGLRSVPVVDPEGHFIGLISKRSMLEFFFTYASDKTPEEFRSYFIGEMIERVGEKNTVTLNHIFEDCLPIITKYPFVPVVEEGRFLGIIKRTDIEEGLERAFGSNEKGIRLLLTISEYKGSLNRLVHALHEKNQNVISISLFDAGDKFIRRVMVKLSKEHYFEDLDKELDQMGYRVLQKRDC